MLNPNELKAWCCRLNLNEPAQKLIGHIRSSGPARRVGGGRSNVSGLYPSRKMGVTIQFESHRVELAAIYAMEHDPLTLEFYDQPPSIVLDYNSAKGKRLSVRHTPDFFVLRQDFAGWEEWKTEEDLSRLTEHNPNRYCQEAGSWHCPPGEHYATQFGLSYQVRCANEIHWRLQRNILFLHDYLNADPEAIDGATRERILGCVRMTPVLSLADLIQQTAEFATPDDIYVLMAGGRLYVDLYAEPLVEPAKVRVFQDRDAAICHGAPPDHGLASAPLQNIHSGAALMWDDRAWKVVNVGNKLVSLLGERGTLVELPQAAVESLVREGRMAQPVADREGHHNITGQLLCASEHDLKVANQRADIVRRHLSGAPPIDGQRISARTLRRWVSRYRAAETQWGAGYLGLLPQTSQRGNSTRRLQNESLQLMDEIIENEYESVKQKSRIACWAMLKESCKQQSVPTPSYTSFCSAVRNRNNVKQTLKRQGPRAAYQHGPFHMELDLKTPRHGDRPFEICHLDHTQLDIELTDTSGTHKIGRPWMTLMIDAFSRRILALHVDFEEPSYRSCMMVLRECVRRHNRLPQCIVVDWGAEFGSTYFEALLARYECTKKARPPAKARFGSLVERAFGTTNTQFIYNLVGNTQITRNVRQVTKSVNPKELAIWPLAPFMERLWEYAYEIYDTNVHPALGESPKDAYERGFQNSGSRLHRLIPYDHDFMIATLPSTPRGTAKISPGRGVKINYIFYWCDGMDDPKIRGQQIPVRFDPFDLGTAYAFIGGQWGQCHSDHYRTFQGRSQKELLVAAKELHAQNRERGSRFQLTASKLAQAFESINVQESLLLQRLRTRETQAVRGRTQPAEECQGPHVGNLARDASFLELSEPISADGQVFERF